MGQPPSPLPRRPGPRRRSVFGAAVLGAALLGTAAAPQAAAASRSAPRRGGRGLPPDAEIARQVRDEFVHSWEGYRRAAWGYDEVRPVSGGHSDFFLPGRTFGLSIVEALDTLFVMELDEEVERAARWIEDHLDVTVAGDLHVFEAVIRLVGGLLSGHLVTGRPALLARCRELADRLLPAFTASPTGIPYTHVDLRTGAVSGSTCPLAEAGSNLPEFGLLSRLTGDGRYRDAAERAYRAVLARRSATGLLGTSLDVETGAWVDTTARAPDPPVDSFYEYLWTGADLLGDRQAATWYRLLTDAVLRHQAEWRDGLLWFRQVDMAGGRTTGRSQSELGAFYSGLLGKGGDLAAGRDYHRSWTSLLDRFPVLPEVVDYGTGRVIAPGNDLRPEYVNSSFDLWRLTGAVEYKRTAYRYFLGLRDHLRVPGGYTVATDVTTRPMALGDLTPGYWYAENPKYLYLMFAASPRFDYRTGLLSTEGMVLRGAVRPGR